ncbi:trehalase family glycosidase [Coraliomargarita algicola]|uniref:Trehalase family glycosidase n=1 Tax=Coraliomargarita algicola TaxID=3092156 RepID=A0ABZ0RJM6_9BACT|nr:trehalase family glycosidase [Coraliomargarita sp. J2-16]WPJ95611.1 trehalase family glycosidase [Coraliomargarita sp. J2-16]
MADFYNYTTPEKDPFQWQQWPIENFTGTHDLLGLGPWGPYGKRYFGLSYLPGPKGLRLDLVCAPELYRRRIALPHAIQDSGYLPWDAQSDFVHYVYRQQILPKDQLFADIHFQRIQENTYQIQIEWCNQSELQREVRLHLCLGMQAMATGAWQPQAIAAVSLQADKHTHWIDALGYKHTDLPYNSAEGLIADGRRRCEAIVPGFNDGIGLHWPEKGLGSHVTYLLPHRHHRYLFIRYQSKQAFSLRLHTDSHTQIVELPASDTPGLSGPIELPLKSTSFRIEAHNAVADFLLDGFVQSAKAQIPQFIEAPQASFAAMHNQSDQQADLEWPALPGRMRIQAQDTTLTTRRYRGDLEQALLLGMHDHVSDEISAPGNGHFHSWITPKLTLPTHASRTQRFTLTWLKQPDAPQAPPRSHSPHSPPVNLDLPGSNAKRFGVDRLAAVLQTNIVYPTYIKGDAIRHYPPGRWWDSLYTWDCGCIGLGLAEIAPRRAVELLNTYLTETDDADCAFIHHGSPVPVQHYLYFDLWQKTQDRDLLAYFYPKLARSLRYLAGLDPRSPTRSFRNNLIATWDLFYNSGGWDDYPPQQYLLRENIERRPHIAPMVVASHVAVAADLMAMAAQELGEDSQQWLNLSQKIATDIDRYAWDPASQLYGYVEHDPTGQAIGLLHHQASGESFNRGLDGAMPAMTARIAPERSQAIWQALADPNKFMTAVGLSTVDQSAPYYSQQGYWNGASWIPYQYFFWKAALDAGQAAWAHSLADQVVRMYSRETEDSYCCFEHFMIESGRGAGWHHFGGLSAPILNLFAAYHTPGRISTGLRTWIHKQTWDSTMQSVEFTVSTLVSNNQSSPLILVALAPQQKVRKVTLDGQDIEYRTLPSGVLEFSIPAARNHLQIIIQ